MLPKSHRLSRPDFLSTRKLGRRVNFSHFSLISRSNALGHLRLSVEISTRIDKRAVYRNRLRRKIVSLLENTPLRNKPVDLIIITKPSTSDNLPALITEVAKLSLHGE